MEIPFSRWYPAIFARHSRRNFDAGHKLGADVLIMLDITCKSFKPFPHARSELVNGPAEAVFRGLAGGYGKVKGTIAFVAFIGDMPSPHVPEEVGFTGEGIILEATALGLNTCWVGGFFRPRTVASLLSLQPNERVLAVTPVGYATADESVEEKAMAGFGRHRNRHPVSRLVSPPGASGLPDWARVCIEAARLAPSAVNRQPWGFRVEPDNLTVFVRTRGPEFNVSKRLDCGIAMLHIEVAARHQGISGEWELLSPPEVARFRITSHMNDSHRDFIK